MKSMILAFFVQKIAPLHLLQEGTEMLQIHMNILVYVRKGDSSVCSGVFF